MAIAFDAVSGATGVSVASLTFAHTVAAGGVLVVLAAELGDTPTVTGVTYDGAALTQLLADTDDSGGVLAKNSAWAIHNPTTGSSKNIVVSFSAAGTAYCAANGLSYTGVVNSSVAAMHRTIYHAGASGGGADVTVVDSQSGDIVVASCGNWTNVISAGAGMTSRKFDTAIGAGNYSYGSEDKSASGASTVMGFTNDNWCTNVAFALIPASGGGATITLPELERLSRGYLRGMPGRI